MSEKAGWECPDKLSLAPVNCVALVAHWRVLVAILAIIPPEYRDEFAHQDDADRRSGIRRQYQERPQRRGESPQGRPRRASSGGGTPATATRAQTAVLKEEVPVEAPKSQNQESVQGGGYREMNLMEGIDSHFHADRTITKLQEKGRTVTLQGIPTTRVGMKPLIPVNVIGGVRVFCDPESYPGVFIREQGFGNAVGLHPKKAHLFNEGIKSRIREALRDPGVVALGEVGLDFTTPVDTWELQSAVFGELLTLSCPDRVLVLHIRDASKYATEARIECIRLLKRGVAPSQRLHIHCFSGLADHVAGWLEAFPASYFGVAGLAEDFDHLQCEAVWRIPPDRLLLETDSPYLRVWDRAQIQTPAYLGEVAEVVARIRGEPIRQILETTASNARELYRL